MNNSTRQLALLGGGAGLGAGLMYLLDPQGGRQRRALARDKATQAYTASSGAVRKSAAGLGDRGRGLAERSRSLATGAGALLSKDGVKDRVLAELIRTRLSRWVSHPRAIQVEVNEGNVILRGHVLSTSSADLLLKVSQLKGVRSVESELEVHASADGVEALQGSSSSSSSALSRLKVRPKTAGLVAGGALAVAGLVRVLRRSDRQDYR
ncbi:MAG TPA: BON domain-containing protein [Thermoanaerobaculia bacterium]|nr:BON domain-containing protein [Thermoanaerobaculia bacterium]